jgi:hypothetical protein
VSTHQHFERETVKGPTLKLVAALNLHSNELAMQVFGCDSREGDREN